MKNTVFQTIHIILIALAVLFGEFAPVGDKVATGAIIGAFVIGVAKVLVDWILDIKNKKYITGNGTITVASLAMFMAGYSLQGILAVIAYLLVNLVSQVIIDKKEDVTDALKSKLPQKTIIFKDGIETEIDVAELYAGNIVVVKPEEKIPADGIVFAGKTTLNMKPIAGHHKEVEVEKGDNVYGGAINVGQEIQVELMKKPENSMFYSMVTSCMTAINEEDSYQEKIGKLSMIFTVLLIVAGIIVAVIPPVIAGYEYAPWIYRGMILLMAASFTNSIYIAKNITGSMLYKLFEKGVLTKKDVLRKIVNVKGILLEKSQRFEEGTYKISHIDDVASSKEEIITLAAHLEYFSEHAIGRTIVDGFIQVARYEGVVDINPVRTNLVEGFEEIKGKGVTGKVAGKFVCAGNKELMAMLNIKNLPTSDKYELVYVAVNQKYLGYIALEYHQKPGVEDVYAAWRDAGIGKYAILDGNREEIARELKEEVGEKNLIAFVGTDNHHGENDQADMGIIMDGLENNLSAESHMVIMDGSLSDIAHIKEDVKEELRKLNTKEIVSFALRILAYTTSAIVAAPAWIAIGICGAVEIALNKIN